MPNSAPQPPGRWPNLVLKRTDQLVAGSILAAGLATLGAYWACQSLWGGGLIDIDQAEPEEIEFLVDVNQADWPEPTRRHFAKTGNRLVFSAKDLPKRAYYDHRDSPALDKAMNAVQTVLAAGSANHKRVFAAGAKAGVSRSSLYKAAKRLGVTQNRGTWSLATAAKSA